MTEDFRVTDDTSLCYTFLMFFKRFLPQLSDLGAISIDGSAPGKTLLITAGVDGDEYSGIDAAHQLIDIFRDRSFSGHIIVIPIVNMPGFMNESSHNPVDGKFPKYLFPGNSRGSSSEQIIASLMPYIDQADCWIDLHSGAITEGLDPFLWLHRTGHRDTDSLIDGLAEKNIADRMLIESCSSSHKASQLARRGKMYIVAESGQRGNRDAHDIALHIQWTKAIMTTLGMIDTPIVSATSPIVMKNVQYVTAPYDGIWQQNPLRPLENGTTIGIAQSFDRTKTKTIVAPVGGYRLWWKETMRMKKGDVLCAIGY